MNRLIYPCLLLCFSLAGQPVQAQTGVPVRVRPPDGELEQNPRYAPLLKRNQYLALDVIGPFGFKRYRFHEGDEIRFKARGEVYRETLYAVTDTTFSILVDNEVMNRMETLSFRFDEIRWIKIDRSIPFVSAGAVMLPLAGGVFAVADFVNPKALDGRSGRFRFDPSSLIPAGALVAGGVLCYKLAHARFRINKNHRLKAM